MSRARVALTVLVLILLLAVLAGLFVYATTHNQAQPLPSPTGGYQLVQGVQLGPGGRVLYKAGQPGFWGRWTSTWRNYRDKYFPRRADYRMDVFGSTGTPVVVSCRIDGSTHAKLFRGIVPTNWVVRAGSRVDFSVKNVGGTNAELGLSISPTNQPPRVYSGPGLIFCPPYFGYGGEEHWGPVNPGGSYGARLTPTNWPVTLPPGMSEQQARTNNFERDWNAARLNYLEQRFAANPQDQGALTEAAAYYWYFKNDAAAEEVYQRFFATESDNSEFLNIAVYAYADHSGTNLQRAYALALKAQRINPRSPEIADTVAWVQFKRGYYQEALTLLPPRDRPRYGVVEETFHAACAQYMLMEEDKAREEFQKFTADKADFPNRARADEEAKKCLGVLSLAAASPDPAAMATLRNRLIEAPDDPVALNRLGAFAEAKPRDDSLLADPLVRKALGVRAYRRGEYALAARELSESAKARSTDGELFLWLGMALKELDQNRQCADALRKAIALGLKDAQVEESSKVLASVTPSLDPHP
jgi:hypothetical protein